MFIVASDGCVLCTVNKSVKFETMPFNWIYFFSFKSLNRSGYFCFRWRHVHSNTVALIGIYQNTRTNQQESKGKNKTTVTVTDI